MDTGVAVGMAGVRVSCQQNGLQPLEQWTARGPYTAGSRGAPLLSSQERASPRSAGSGEHPETSVSGRQHPPAVPAQAAAFPALTGLGLIQPRTLQRTVHTWWTWKRASDTEGQEARKGSE